MLDTIKVKNIHNKDNRFKVLPGLKVEIVGNSKEELEMALQKFKRLLEKTGILNEYKKRQFYVKPSVQKKEKRKNNAK